MEFTLFEVHLPNAEFNAPFAGRERGQAAETTGDVSAAGGPSSRLGPVFVFLSLVSFALLARYLRGGEAEQTTLDEVEA